MSLTATVALAGVSAGASSPRAVLARGGSRLLEPPLTVLPTGEIKDTRTRLVKGDSYRLVLTGTVTITNDFGTSDRFDPLYCYETFGTPPIGGPTTGSCTTNTRRQASLTAGIGKPVGGLIEYQLNRSLLNKIPYQPSHRYEIPFHANRTGKLAFQFFTTLAQKTGSFQVALYGQPKRKAARPHACAASAGPTATAASCAWFLNFTVSQKGLPEASIPAPAADFAGTQTDAVGKVFFNTKPKPGRWSTGHAAALIIHTDLYQSPLPPFASEEGEIIMRATTARYRRVFNLARLTVSGQITSISGREYDPQHGNPEPGDKGGVDLTSDSPTHQHDRLRFTAQCALCGAFKGDENHFHSRTAQDTLKVSVGAPQPCTPRACQKP